eukprot:gb/GECG01011418.1/.p1 GENE.gb/GECG01011418.1/~~gb/GECG01011418.1/.p1  ORF type:complete len:114 (+),score=10.25 gb/GECG01011418.1/:1-342(+)
MKVATPALLASERMYCVDVLSSTLLTARVDTMQFIPAVLNEKRPPGKRFKVTAKQDEVTISKGLQSFIKLPGIRTNTGMALTECLFITQNGRRGIQSPDTVLVFQVCGIGIVN